MEVIQWHRDYGKNMHTTSQQVELDKKQIRECDKNFENLLEQNYRKAKLRRKLINGAPVFSEDVDDVLFFGCNRSAGSAVSNWTLSEQPIKIASSLQLRNFVASNRYINRRKQRFGVAMRCARNESQKTTDEFMKQQGPFDLPRTPCDGATTRHAANMDQTIVRVDNPASRTNNAVGERTNTGHAS
ncbi:hypothetical protein HPB50_005174 [Hyalomma asiaticum]|uniref:Uncharacterized protein n=1 Tax=Hyalomma asiaticum TaxID=266040 RepID=A0ACB7RQH8_HYAAI|nr:hypothetical protein HPB50_005174 [Hyalomma asiaticum]